MIVTDTSVLPLFRLSAYAYKIPSCNSSPSNETYLQGDFSSSAEFFVCIGVFGFLYCTATLILYLGYQHVYRQTTRGPIIVSTNPFFIPTNPPHILQLWVWGELGEFLHFQIVLCSWSDFFLSPTEWSSGSNLALQVAALLGHVICPVRHEMW